MSDASGGVGSGHAATASAEPLSFEQVIAAERAELETPDGPLAAICLSGGGIRSASLCLGVLQGFAKARLLRQFHYLSTVSGGGYIGGFLTACIASQNDPASAARRMRKNPLDYVETDILAAVGDREPTELSDLRRYTNYLTPDPGLASPDTWAGIILWFRNTLINWFIFFPLFVAVAAAPILYFAIVCMTAAVASAISGSGFTVLFTGIVGLTALACLYAGILQTIINLPSHQHPDSVKRAAAADHASRHARPGLSGFAVFWRIIVFAIGWSLLAPVAVVPALRVPEAVRPAGQAFTAIAAPTGADVSLAWVALLPILSACIALIAHRHAESIVVGTYIEAVRNSADDDDDDTRALRLHRKAFTVNRWAWIASAVLAAAMLAAGFWLVRGAGAIWLSLFGPLWVILTETLRITLYVALRRWALRADLDREWLARMNGVQVQYAITLCAVGVAVLLFPILVAWAKSTLVAALAAGTGVVVGPLTALAGRSARTAGVPSQETASSVKQERLLYAGIVVFAASLLALNGWIDRSVLLFVLDDGLPRRFLPWTTPVVGFGLSAGCFLATWRLRRAPVPGEDQKSVEEQRQIRTVIGWTLLFFGIAIAVAVLWFWAAILATPRGAPLAIDVQYFVVALFGILLCVAMVFVAFDLGRRIDLNDFSMHAVYRNRLVRAFLGSARDPALRHDDRFTQFDPADDIRVYDTLDREKRGPATRLLHVVNIALNRTSGKDTARAERKATSFTVSPLHCGSRTLGGGKGAYVATERYAPGEQETGPQDKQKGITLGTAITLSGAAVSPNMGYHSSPLIAFVMTLFNVRLGAWLPNPALPMPRPGERRSAVPSLLSELAGRSDITGPLVYLSDGGHFDNLGLYEMLQRRCRHIVVVDAGQDKDYAYYDLGTTLQHARIDLGIEVGFVKEVRIKAPALSEFGAYAEIVYPPRDETGARTSGDGQDDIGRLLLLKSWLPPDSPTDIRAFQALKQNFPHDTTGNQFFTESDFESYRRLGEFLAETMIRRAAGESGLPDPDRDARDLPPLSALFPGLPELFDGLARLAHAKDAPPADPTAPEEMGASREAPPGAGAEVARPVRPRRGRPTPSPEA